MSIIDYATLKTSIAGWLKRTNLTDRIPDFVSLAEAKLNRDLRVRQMSAVYQRTTDQNVISLPDDYLAAEKLELDGYTLTYTPRWSASGKLLGLGDGTLYTVIGNSVWIQARIECSTLFKLFYYVRLTPLSDQEPKNWLIEDAPDAYLYGALLQAEPYLKNDSRVQIWQAMYQATIEAMNAQNAAARTSGSALVARAS